VERFSFALVAHFILLRLTLADDNGVKKVPKPLCNYFEAAESVCVYLSNQRLGWEFQPNQKEGGDIPALLTSSTFTPSWLLCLDEVGNLAGKTAI
jgi:hypothetical protein